MVCQQRLEQQQTTILQSHTCISSDMARGQFSWRYAASMLVGVEIRVEIIFESFP